MKSAPYLLYSDKEGMVYDDPCCLAAGFDGKEFVRLCPGDFSLVPEDSRLFFMEGCRPVGWSLRSRFMTPAAQDVSAVSVFLAPGHLRLLHPAAVPSRKRAFLPLWAYTAAGFLRGRLYAASLPVDRCERWLPCNYDDRDLLPGIRSFRKMFRKNRLVAHLSGCATEFHCFNAKNLFLGRWEAPLPISRSCNARCRGCISNQEESLFPASHSRISFRPAVREVVQIGAYHLETARDAIVSFGQGCEGEPLLEADIMESAIREIRRQTRKGVIHLNTNGYSPERIKRLGDAGLDSIRISLSSAREKLYRAYYRPRGYAFKQVAQSIQLSSSMGIFTSLNYLVFPGVSDEEDEWKELKRLIGSARPHMIQLRNLNIDPFYYLDLMKKAGALRSSLMGVCVLLKRIKEEYPDILIGAFNRTKEEIDRFYKKGRVQRKQPKKS